MHRPTSSMEPTDHNRRAFDDAHRTSENVLATPGIPAAIRERLHGLGGSRVLHLLCGTGRESIELAELGALVTGVDDDEAALEAARRAQPEVPWVHADVARAAARAPARPLGPRLPRRRLARPRSAHSTPGRAGRGGAPAGRRPARSTTSIQPRACLDAFGRWRGDYFAERRRSATLVDAVIGAGLVLRGLEEWPGKDERIPGAPRPRGRRPELRNSGRGEHGGHGNRSAASSSIAVGRDPDVGRHGGSRGPRHQRDRRHPARSSGSSGSSSR